MRDTHETLRSETARALGTGYGTSVLSAQPFWESTTVLKIKSTHPKKYTDSPEQAPVGGRRETSGPFPVRDAGGDRVAFRRQAAVAPMTLSPGRALLPALLSCSSWSPSCLCISPNLNNATLPRRREDAPGPNPGGAAVPADVLTLGVDCVRGQCEQERGTRCDCAVGVRTGELWGLQPSPTRGSFRDDLCNKPAE